MYCWRVSNLKPFGAIIGSSLPLVSVGSSAFMSRAAMAARCASTAVRNGGSATQDVLRARFPTRPVAPGPREDVWALLLYHPRLHLSRPPRQRSPREPPRWGFAI